MGAARRQVRFRIAGMAVLVVGLVGLVPVLGTGAGAAAQTPQIWIAKSGVDLGPAVPFATTAAQVITLKNTGGATATSLAIGSPSPNTFSRTTTCGSSLAVRTTCTITVRFAPTAGPSTVTGFVNVSWSGGLKSIALTGHALASTFPFRVTARTLDFGEIPAGSLAPTQAVIVTNQSGAAVPAAFTGGSVPAPFTSSNSCAGATLAPGGSCSFVFGFKPTAVTSSSATSTIVLTGGGVTRSIPIALHGVGLPPIEVTATALDFGEVPLQVPSSPQAVVVRNIGSTPAPLTVTVSNPAGFSATNGCSGVVLSPGGTCGIAYTFLPTSAGPKASTSKVVVSVTGTTVTTSRTVALTGTGLTGNRTQAFLISPLAFDFGNVGVGASAETQTVTFTNVSGTTLTPNMAGGAAGSFGGSQNCQGVPIAPGASCEVSYRYSPRQVGPETGSTSLTFATGGAFPTQSPSFTFQGRGTEPFLVSPRGFDFGNAPVGVPSPSQSVNITNVTTATVTPNMAGGAAGTFGGSQDCQGVPIAPGAGCHVTYRFLPSAAGPTTGSTSMSISVGTGTYRQELSYTFLGVGTTSAGGLVATPNVVDFGDVSAGLVSPVQPIVVTNTGNVSVTAIAFGTSPDARFKITGGCTTLAAGASCTFNATFTASTTTTGKVTVNLVGGGQTVPVQLSASPRATPAPANDSFTTFVDTTRTVTAPANGLLANDVGIGLVVAGHVGPSHGTLTTNFDGTYTYVPTAGFHGKDTFTYQALDTVSGTRNATATVTVAYSPNQAFTQAAFKDFVARAPSDAELRAVAGQLDAKTLTRSGEVGALSSSTEYVSVLVNSFYVNTLGRKGEAGGVGYWVDQIRTGKRTVAQVAAFFYASDEYFGGIGGGTNTSWITDLYKKLLGRNPDSAGLAYWNGQVQSAGRTSVAGRFYQSTESAHARVKALYQALLGRNPDQAGWDFWAAQIPAKGDLSLAANLASSDEYFARAHTRFP